MLIGSDTDMPGIQDDEMIWPDEVSVTPRYLGDQVGRRGFYAAAWVNHWEHRGITPHQKYVRYDKYEELLEEVEDLRWRMKDLEK